MFALVQQYVGLPNEQFSLAYESFLTVKNKDTYILIFITIRYSAGVQDVKQNGKIVRNSKKSITFRYVFCI